LTENVTDDAPAGTVTVDGIETAFGTPADKLTVQPPVPAGAARVIVPVALPFPPIVAGFKLNPVIWSPTTSRLVVLYEFAESIA